MKRTYYPVKQSQVGTRWPLFQSWIKTEYNRCQRSIRQFSFKEHIRIKMMKPLSLLRKQMFLFSCCDGIGVHFTQRKVRCAASLPLCCQGSGPWELWLWVKNGGTLNTPPLWHHNHELEALMRFEKCCNPVFSLVSRKKLNKWRMNKKRPKVRISSN